MKTLKESLIDAVNEAAVAFHVDNEADIEKNWDIIWSDIKDLINQGVLDKDLKVNVGKTRYALDCVERDYKKHEIYNIVNTPEECTYNGELIKIAVMMQAIKYPRLAAKRAVVAELYNIYREYPYILESMLVMSRCIIEHTPALMDIAIEDEDAKTKTPAAERKYNDFIKYYNSKVIPAFKSMVKTIDITLKNLLKGDDPMRIEKNYSREVDSFSNIIVEFLTKKFKDYAELQYPGMD